MTGNSDYSSERFRIQPGDPLFKTEDPTTSFYVLSRGQIELRHEGKPFATVADRDHPIGTPSFVLRIPRQYTAVAGERSVVKEFDLDPDNFFDWLDDHPMKLPGIISNYARLVDHFNEINESNFERFRKYRSITDSFVRPFARLTSGLKRVDRRESTQLTDELLQLLAENPFESILTSYRRIVDTTGRSAHSNISDHDVPETSVETYESGETICKEGAEGSNFYVLINGSLSVLKGNQRLSTIDDRGSVFGEMAPALGDNRHATVQAETKSEVSIIPYERLQYVLEESPDFSHKLVGIFFKRFRRAVKLHQQLKEFLRFMKQLNESEGLDENLKNYLKDLVGEVEHCQELDKDVRSSAEELRKWYVEEADSLGDEIPSGDLSDFTSGDITY